ncbi:conserved exported hypothetical protein [Candidatus Nitrotoga sp. BS]|uniref:hypothetical protein n=1 Tax=Candidatus Nitrotoga sp. BS TaxID=2890408 RepID=UPI001EF285CC|nr:hypothetical protein [Candidatus Nitrotoga sp. BS]CAH1204021.1 conserved exported hypothetical protein [Candidatus Nitrotoga sp. BS]
MNKNHLIALLLFSLLGCSSNAKKDDNKYYFNTHITQNNVKEFSISKEFKERNEQKSSSREGRRGGGRGERNQNSDRTGTDKNSKFYIQLEVALEKELAISNYCTSGYTEIERHSSQGFYSIRGQCNELNE